MTGNTVARQESIARLTMPDVDGELLDFEVFNAVGACSEATVRRLVDGEGVR